MERPAPAMKNPQGGMRLGDRTDTFLFAALALLLLLVLGDWLRSGFRAPALDWLLFGLLLLVPALFALLYLPALALAAMAGRPHRPEPRQHRSDSATLLLLGLTRPELSLSLVAYGLACMLVLADSWLRQAGAATRLDCTEVPVSYPPPLLNGVGGGVCAAEPLSLLPSMLPILVPVCIGTVLLSLAGRALLRRIIAPREVAIAGFAARSTVPGDSAATVAAPMRFGDRIFDAVTVCAVPVLAFLVWDLVRRGFEPVELAWIPVRLLYLVLMLFPLIYLPAVGAALATGRAVRTPWRWRRSVAPPGAPRPRRRPGGALVLLFLGVIMLSLSLERMPDVQDHFRLHVQPCTPELQELGGHAACNPVPQWSLDELIALGLLLGGMVIGFALLVRVAPILAWCLLRNRPGIGWRPTAMAESRTHWRLGERLGSAFAVAAGLSLALLAFDAVRTAFRAPTLEWLPLAILFGPVLLFGPVYLGTLISTRPRPGRPRRKPRPLLTAVALAASCGCWLSALLFVAMAHTATDLHYEACKSIPLPYPAPFLGPQGGLHDVCVPKTRLSTFLLLYPAAAIGAVFAAAILMVWALTDGPRRRGWP